MTEPTPQRRRSDRGNGQSNVLSRAFYRARRIAVGLLLKSVSGFLIITFSATGAGTYAFFYGVVTGPRELRAQALDNVAQWKAIETIQREFVQFRNSRVDDTGFIRWLVQKQCGRFPVGMRLYGDDAVACGKVAMATGNLFAAPDTFVIRRPP